MGQAVGLGPDPHPPGLGEGPIGRREQHAPIERYLEPVTHSPKRERLPSVARHPCIRTGELDPATIDNTIEPDIVLQRIGADDVVVPRVPVPDDQARRLIHPAVHWPKAHGEGNVTRFEAIQDGEGEARIGAVAARLRQHARSRRRGRILQDDPAWRRAAAGQREGEPRGRDPRGRRLEILHDVAALCRRGSIQHERTGSGDHAPPAEAARGPTGGVVERSAQAMTERLPAIGLHANAEGRVWRTRKAG